MKPLTYALAATTALAAAPRAISGFRPRADAADPTAVLGEVKTAFEAFKATNDERLKALEKGKADAVTNEKLEKINTDLTAKLTALETAVDAQAKAIAAGKLGGAGGDSRTAEQKAHAEAFDAWFRRDRGDPDALHALAVKAALTKQSDPDGGVFVPAEMETTIDRVLGKVSAMRGMATIRQVSGGGFKKPVNLGGTSSGWTDSETKAPTETSTPKLSVLDFPTKTLWAQPAATTQLLEDAIVDIAAWLADEVSIEFAEQEGDAFINGDGVSEPKGILAYAKVADSGYAWGKLGFIKTGGAAGFAASSPADALIDLIYAPKTGYRTNARFIMNRKTCATVRKFRDGDGNYMWSPPLVAGQPALLLGYPVSDDDNMPDLAANAFPVAFGDFRRGYLIADRRGIQVLRDPFTAKPYVLFYTTKRVGGGVQDFAAIKLLKCEA